MKKSFYESCLVFVCFVVLVVLAGVLVFGLANSIGEHAYCMCMGSQPYITTKYYEGRCLMNVLSYEELDIVQYLFICEGRCR